MKEVVHVTPAVPGPTQSSEVIAPPAPLWVTIVSRDPDMRLAVARAFDTAPSTWKVRMDDPVPASADVIVLTPEVEDVPEADVPTIAFDPFDPGSTVAAVAEAGRARPPRITSVLGATGGCGATTIAMYLTRSLGPGSAFVELGDPASSTLTARFSLDLSGERAGPVTIEGFHAYVLPDTSLLSDLNGYRRVVVDQGYGAEPLDGISTLCVLPPSLTAARRASRMIVAGPAVPWIVVTNRVGAGGTSTRMELQRELGAPISLELPGCPALRDAEETGRMSLPTWRPWHRHIGRLARALERHGV